MKTVIGLAVIGVMAASTAGATGIGVGVKAGTLGVGAEVTKSLTPKLNARVGLNTFSYDTTLTESDMEYDAEIEFNNASAMLDWHPFGGTFRFSVGYLFNNNEGNLVARPTDPSTWEFNLGGTSYQLDNLSGKVTFANGGYLGMGWGNAGDRAGLGLSLDLGVAYQGSPKVKLSAEGTDNVIDDPNFQNALAQEEADARESMANYKYFPVISLGVSYAF